MSENLQPNEGQQPLPDIEIVTRAAAFRPVGTVPAQVPPGQIAGPSIEHDALLKSARNVAFTSLRKLREMVPTDAFVRINKSLLERWAKTCFERYFHTLVESVDDSSYDVYEKYYVDACFAHLKSLLSKPPEVGQEPIKFLWDEKETRLWELAKRDREIFSPELKDTLLRDLAITRAVLMLNIGQEDVVNHIETIRNYATVYQTYYVSALEEVTWPVEGTFS